MKVCDRSLQTFLLSSAQAHDRFCSEAEAQLKMCNEQLAALYADQKEHEYQLHAVVVQEG